MKYTSNKEFRMPNVNKWACTVQRWSKRLLLVALGLWCTAALVAQEPKRPLVEIRTDLGTMVVALYNETPLHRDNFLKLVREGAYDSLLFHQVVPGFMLHAGDPESKYAGPDRPLGTGDPGYTLPAEIVPGIVHEHGSLGAARQGDQVNPDRRSNGMMFYIVDGRTYGTEDLDRMAARAARQGDTISYTAANRTAYARHGGTPQLDGAYTIFGKVVSGQDVLTTIARLPRNAQDRPLKDLRMTMHIVE